jgi:hypothetical protein
MTAKNESGTTLLILNYRFEEIYETHSTLINLNQKSFQRSIDLQQKIKNMISKRSPLKRNKYILKYRYTEEKKFKKLFLLRYFLESGRRRSSRGTSRCISSAAGCPFQAGPTSNQKLNLFSELLLI